VSQSFPVGAGDTPSIVTQPFNARHVPYAAQSSKARHAGCYYFRMTVVSNQLPNRFSFFSGIVRLVTSTWRVLHFGALALVVVLSSATHDQACRRNTAHELYWTTWQVLPSFTLLSTLLSLVLIRIVIVTALSYGLSQLALEMVIRVLVVELIPLFAALFVSLRCGARFAEEIGAALNKSGSTNGSELWRHTLVPRLTAGAFAVAMLAAVSGLVALLIAYTSLYGFSPWGRESFSSALAQVFDTAVLLGFMLKVMLFSLAVGILPIASALAEQNIDIDARRNILSDVARLALALVLIEIAFLAVKYA
jgi:phospholipid/cholesterol/gamma-HCH transport system permease protein